MNTLFLTLLFFPDWGSSYPPDFLILHFFIAGIFIPFLMIFRRARNYDRNDPKSSLDGYKSFNKTEFVGYEETN